MSQSQDANMLELLTQERNLRFARSAMRAARDRVGLARDARRAVAQVASPDPCAQADFRKAYMLVTHLVQAESLPDSLGVPADEIDTLLWVLANIEAPRCECDDLGIAATSAFGLAIQTFDRLHQIARDSGLAELLKLEWKASEVMRQLEDPVLVRRMRAGASMSPDEAKYYQQMTNDLARVRPDAEPHYQFSLREQLAPVLIGTSVHAEIRSGKPFVWAGMSDPMLDRIRSELEPEYRALERAASVDGRVHEADGG